MLRLKRRRSECSPENSQCQTDKKSLIRISLAFLVSASDLIACLSFNSQIGFFSIFPHFSIWIFPAYFLEPGVVACWFLYNFSAFFSMNIPCLFFRTRSGCTSRCPPPPAAPSPFRIWRWGVGPRPPVPAQPPPIRIPATIRTSLPLFTLTGKIYRLYISFLLLGLRRCWCERLSGQKDHPNTVLITQKNFGDFFIQPLESGSWRDLCGPTWNRIGYDTLLKAL